MGVVDAQFVLRLACDAEDCQDRIDRFDEPYKFHGVDYSAAKRRATAEGWRVFLWEEGQKWLCPQCADKKHEHRGHDVSYLFS